VTKPGISRFFKGSHLSLSADWQDDGTASKITPRVAVQGGGAMGHGEGPLIGEGAPMGKFLPSRWRPSVMPLAHRSPCVLPLNVDTRVAIGRRALDRTLAAVVVSAARHTDPASSQGLCLPVADPSDSTPRRCLEASRQLPIRPRDWGGGGRRPSTVRPAEAGQRLLSCVLQGARGADRGRGRGRAVSQRDPRRRAGYTTQLSVGLDRAVGCTLARREDRHE
jgi:hypothetical protein